MLAGNIAFAKAGGALKLQQNQGGWFRLVSNYLALCLIYIS